MYKPGLHDARTDASLSRFSPSSSVRTFACPPRVFVASSDVPYDRSQHLRLSERQGCTDNGVLLTMALDPVVRYLCETVLHNCSLPTFVHSSACAYADDDFAVATISFRLLMPPVAHALQTIDAVAGMKINEQ